MSAPLSAVNAAYEGVRAYRAALEHEARKRPVDGRRRIKDARNDAVHVLSLAYNALPTSMESERTALHLMGRDIMFGILGVTDLDDHLRLISRLGARIVAAVDRPACELCDGAGEAETALGTGERRVEPCPRCEERRAGEQDLALTLGDAPEAESEAA